MKDDTNFDNAADIEARSQAQSMKQPQAQNGYTADETSKV